MYDVLIVGGGPAGLAAALAAKRRGLSYLLLERGSIASTIEAYPRARLLFSTSDEVELEQGALLGPGKRPTREELLAHYISVAEGEGINLRTSEGVERIAKTNQEFLIDTTAKRYSSRTVIVAIGGFGRPRKLGVPGEDPSRVSYLFVEARSYAMRPVLVVGGGNSAAEAALELAEAAAKVVLSFRRPSPDSGDVAGGATPTAGSSKVKPWVREPLERAAARGLIRIEPSSSVAEIRSATAILRVGASERTVEVECDHVFALIGADPDTGLLEDAGAEIAADGRPVYDSQTFETTVPGLHVAGHITRDLHMKNAGLVARRVVDHIACSLLKLPAAHEACPTAS